MWQLMRHIRMHRSYRKMFVRQQIKSRFRLFACAAAQRAQRKVLYHLRHMKNAARGCRFRQEIFYLLQEVRIWAAMQKMKQLRIDFLCVCFREKKAFVYVRQMALLGVRSLQCRDRFPRI